MEVVVWCDGGVVDGEGARLLSVLAVQGVDCRSGLYVRGFRRVHLSYMYVFDDCILQTPWERPLRTPSPHEQLDDYYNVMMVTLVASRGLEPIEQRSGSIGTPSILRALCLMDGAGGR